MLDEEIRCKNGSNNGVEQIVEGITRYLTIIIRQFSSEKHRYRFL